MDSIKKNFQDCGDIEWTKRHTCCLWIMNVTETRKIPFQLESRNYRFGKKEVFCVYVGFRCVDSYDKSWKKQGIRWSMKISIRSFNGTPGTMFASNIRMYDIVGTRVYNSEGICSLDTDSETYDYKTIDFDPLQLYCALIDISPAPIDLADETSYPIYWGVKPKPNQKARIRHDEPHCQCTLSQIFSSLLEDQSQSDVTFIVQDVRFLAHKNILAVQSPVFKAMFTHDMKERNDNTVTIDDCDPKVFKHMLTSIYTNTFDKEENLFDLYRIAHKYALHHITEKCVSHIRSNITANNIMCIILLANQYCIDNLLMDAVDYIMWNPDESIENMDFNELCRFPDVVKLIMKHMTT